MCLGMFFFLLTLLVDFGTAWICGFIFFIILGNFWSVTSSNTSLFLLGLQLHKLGCLILSHISLRLSSIFQAFFSLCFSSTSLYSFVCLFFLFSLYGVQSILQGTVCALKSLFSLQFPNSCLQPDRAGPYTLHVCLNIWSKN